MQRTKSYMLPKLILLNMLALMMITFEHEVPADNNPLLSSAQSGPMVAAKPEANTVAVAAAALPPAVKVAAVEEVKVDEDKQTAMKKTAVYKKRVQQKHSAIKPHAMVLKASYTSNTPLGCCFRGNRI